VGKAKDIVLRPIKTGEANTLVRRVHYSGKVDTRTQLSIGVFYRGSLEGAIQFGPSMDKRKTIGFVAGTQWHQYLDLHRIAFTERLPRNSESRAIGVACRMLRKHAPQVKWVLSYADATQCGDGTIYRASGFVLTQIRRNTTMVLMPDGETCAQIVFHDSFSPNSGGASVKARYGKIPGESVTAFFARVGARKLPGYQFRYVRFIDPTWADRLTVPVIPFSEIPDECRMYRGEKMRARSTSGDPADQAGDGGAKPTRALHLPSEE
jgi:hypothetical protein